MDHAQEAERLFYEGYNCAQSVFVAFRDLTGCSKEEAARLSSSFGGGMGRMREVCGAVSGMLMALGALSGYETPGDDAAKAAHYRRVQALAGKFREETGSIICREILKDAPSDPNPTPRTADFYAKRPCARMVRLAASILDEYLSENPPGEMPWKT